MTCLKLAAAFVLNLIFPCFGFSFCILAPNYIEIAVPTVNKYLMFSAELEGKI
jgi:hypothetical protein